VVGGGGGGWGGGTNGTFLMEEWWAPEPVCTVSKKYKYRAADFLVINQLNAQNIFL